LPSGIGIVAAVGAGAPAQQMPIEERLSRTVTTKMSKTCTNNLWNYMASEKCTPGKIWEVTRISIGQPNDPSAVVAGNIYAGVGVQVPQDSPNPYPMVDTIAVTGTIPTTTYPLVHSVILQEGERVIIGMKGLPAAQEMAGVVAVIEHDRAAFLRSLTPQPPPRMRATGTAPDQ
jgi:hypothetical protein